MRNNIIYCDGVRKKMFYNFFIGYGLIVVMIATSIFFNGKEIILPEVAALSIGSLIYQEQNWLARPFQIFYLPSITAVLGFYTNQLDINLEFKLILVLVFVVAILRIFKSYLAPAFATGLLPVITNATSYYFIFSILFFTLVLALSIKLLGLTKQNITPSKPHLLPRSILYLGLVSVWILLCGISGWMYMSAIPPVIVVGYESMHKENYTIKILQRQIISLTFAAFIGSQALHYLDNYLIVTIVDITGVYLVLKFLKFNLPPAYAIAILPMVLSENTYPYFALHVLIMASSILGVILVYKSSYSSKILKI